MSAFVKLPKAITAKSYCLCFIAERSIDFAATNPSIWHDFVSFFSPNRKQWFEDLYRELPNVATSSSPTGQTGSPFYLILLRLWALLRPCPSLSVFNESELGLIRTSLANFQDVIMLEKPEPARLTAIRRDLGNCQWIIERKWFNQKRWNVLRMADHFCRNPMLGEAFDVETAVAKFIEN